MATWIFGGVVTAMLGGMAKTSSASAALRSGKRALGAFLVRVEASPKCRERLGFFQTQPGEGVYYRVVKENQDIEFPITIGTGHVNIPVGGGMTTQRNAVFGGITFPDAIQRPPTTGVVFGDLTKTKYINTQQDMAGFLRDIGMDSTSVKLPTPVEVEYTPIPSDESVVYIQKGFKKIHGPNVVEDWVNDTVMSPIYTGSAVGLTIAACILFVDLF